VVLCSNVAAAVVFTVQNELEGARQALMKLANDDLVVDAKYAQVRRCCSPAGVRCLVAATGDLNAFLTELWASAVRA
jgi:hypothetical protein